MDPLKPPARRPSNYPLTRPTSSAPAPRPSQTQTPPVVPVKTRRRFSWLTFLLTLFLTAAIVGGGVYIWQQQANQDALDAKQSEIDVLKAQPAATNTTATPSTTGFTVVSTSLTSPDGSYVVTQTQAVDGSMVTGVKDKAGKVIASNIPTQAEADAMKIPGQYGTKFYAWSSNTKFTMIATVGDGSEYLFTVDATTGKVDTTSVKKVK